VASRSVKGLPRLGISFDSGLQRSLLAPRLLGIVLTKFSASDAVGSVTEPRVARSVGARTKKLRRPAVTSGWLWGVLVVVVSGLAAFRFPVVLGHLRAIVDPVRVAEIGDESLLNTALTVGVVTGIVVFAVGFVVCAFIGGFLERRFAPRGIGKPDGMRIGVAFAVIAVIALPLQLGALLFQLPAVPRTPLSYGWIALVVLVVPYFFRARDGGARGCIGPYAIAAIFGVFLCIQ